MIRPYHDKLSLSRSILLWVQILLVGIPASFRGKQDYSSMQNNSPRAFSAPHPGQDWRGRIRNLIKLRKQTEKHFQVIEIKSAMNYTIP
ncbi:MAG: hypothetical protein DKM50_02680 [Candidatus Margulisiibacteriota bacterium]|nr:MAG: hypothetical protein A2X43_03545 [Candidatus Margulisbacteria bacterium GWD2_39_127]OGI02512.1 MAG: hypothetical protein A2X42_07500 [Candidatus Margulisbacteria bacterium GWF2_38_17]OGI11005.1 MAG: hypothetical protein A2X41_02025 [Candidatus Margulisbacteria bacterium GWE2_39_32]PZM83198.1 MAG: hypothetical protein DKM50_02680 [Candidatus Margulisiibacteriota bacterium]HAR62497.1 hypothetical protein [Candidatus Margulisiibacteriota bacterium]